MLSTKMLVMKCQSTYDNMLPCNTPDEITRFSHAVVRIFCLVVYYLVFGACGIQESDVKIKGTAANCVALASAIMSRLRKTKASVLQYRISTVLSKLTTKSSVQREKLKRFVNKLRTRLPLLSGTQRY